MTNWRKSGWRGSRSHHGVSSADTPDPAKKAESPRPKIRMPIAKPITVKLDPKAYAWCSCGQSKERPFCDGSHKAVEGSTGPVQFKVTAPVNVRLCGCTKTDTPPYCDGSHARPRKKKKEAPAQVQAPPPERPSVEATATEVGEPTGVEAGDALAEDGGHHGEG